LFIVSSQDLDSGGEETVSSVAEEARWGRAGVDGGYGGELVATCPVLHERVGVSVALDFDDCVAQRLVGGPVAFELGDTKLGRRSVVFALCPRYQIQWLSL